MNKNASYGVFPSQTAVRSKSTGDLRDLYFKTTQQKMLTGQTIPSDEQPENFDHIHNMGKKTTRYMKFQRNTAPLVDRTACRYHQEFIPKPLGDNECNRELAKTFKGDTRPKVSPPSQAKSSYAEGFVRPSREQLRGSRQGSCAPKQIRTQTLGGIGESMELHSHAHANYMAHDTGMARGTRAPAPKPNLTLAGSYVSELNRSHYQRDFVGAQQKAVTDADWADYMPKLPAWVAEADPSMHQTRRTCFLSPGM